MTSMKSANSVAIARETRYTLMAATPEGRIRPAPLGPVVFRAALQVNAEAIVRPFRVVIEAARFPVEPAMDCMRSPDAAAAGATFERGCAASGCVDHEAAGDGCGTSGVLQADAPTIAVFFASHHRGLLMYCDTAAARVRHKQTIETTAVHVPAVSEW